MTSLEIKRVYQPYSTTDGYRILIDRLWPRGIKKDGAHIDAWMKDLGASNELRKSFHEGEMDWEDFKKEYYDELQHSPILPLFLNLVSEQKKVTLLYAAKDEVQNNAVALKEWLTKKMKANH